MASDVYLQIDGIKGKVRRKYSQQKISSGGAPLSVDGIWRNTELRRHYYASQY